MTIPFGRRRLLISFIAAPQRASVVQVPAAADATDAELARLGGYRAAMADRARWEAQVALYGGLRPR